MNFFLGLGNWKSSPLMVLGGAAGPVIFSCADLLYQPATHVQLLRERFEPSPRTFTGCL
jgi:hypothetical protein